MADDHSYLKSDESDNFKLTIYCIESYCWACNEISTTWHMLLVALACYSSYSDKSGKFMQIVKLHHCKTDTAGRRKTHCMLPLTC